MGMNRGEVGSADIRGQTLKRARGEGRKRWGRSAGLEIEERLVQRAVG